MPVDLVIDADGHCSEPVDGLAAWMPAEYASAAPVSFRDRDGGTRWLIEGRLASKRGGLGSGPNGPFAPQVVTSRDGMHDPQTRLRDMDEEGIDAAIIFGTPVALTVNGLSDKALAGAMCHAVNRWLVEEYLAADRRRLKGVGLIPCQDPPQAARELDYLAQHGAVCAMLPTNVYGINMGDRRFDPIYAAAQEIGMPLAVHPQTGHDGEYGRWGVMGAGSERMEKYSYVHMTAFPFELMIALMHMIGEGVLGLRRAFHLAGARTVVMTLWAVPDEQTTELMVDFYQRVHAERQGRCFKLRGTGIIDCGHDDENAVGAVGARLGHLIGVVHEILAQHRQRACCARLA